MPPKPARAAHVAVACATAIAAAPAAATEYHVVPLAGVNAQSGGINKDEIVAGAVGFVPALFDHGAITMLGGDSGFATAVNAKGNATGTSYGGGRQHAFLWKNGTPRDIAPMFGATDATQGVAIDKDSGVLCVESAPGGTRSFVFLEGRYTEVKGPPGYGYVTGAAINDAGDVAGNATPPARTAHAFARIGGVSTDLGALGGAKAWSTATAINLAGVVAGDSAKVAGTTADVTAFTWTAGVLKNLGALKPATRSRALAIDWNGRVVGTSYADAGNTQPRAFLHDGTHMIDLNKRLDAASAGWVLETATGIAAGGAITGMGSFGGSRMPYLATPLSR